MTSQQPDARPPTPDPVNHPSHYTAHPSGVECIQVTEHMGFNVGNAVKYLWRAGLKSDDPVQDLRKAAWYVQREIDRLTPKCPNCDGKGYYGSAHGYRACECDPAIEAEVDGA